MNHNLIDLKEPIESSQMVLKDSQARENLTMDSTGTTFTTRRGYFITTTSLILWLAFFICTLIAVGFIVYSFVTCPELSEPVRKVCEHQCFNHGGLIHGDSNRGNSEENKSPSATTLQTVKDVRLPRSVIPISYNISLIPFLYPNNFTFNGEVLINIKILEDCKNITIHSTELNIFKIYTKIVKKNASNMNLIIIKQQYFIEPKQFFIIEVNDLLEKGEEYSVYIKFSGKILDFLQGFYRSSYEIDNEQRFLASTQFQPTDARRAFPCFDEPALKAKFTINIARPKNMSSLSNMPKIEGPDKPVENLPDYLWDNYEESFPMSTYLIAFTVSDFVNKSNKNGNFSVWTRENAIETAEYALSIGPKILKNLENYFQIEFPLPKIDMIAIPDFHAGAMENWGLITYRETAMLFQEGVSSTTSKQRIAAVVGHELAHQWFGNLVTPSWWSDIWLNEGFASYMEYLAVDDVEPEWKTMDQFVVLELQDVAILDAMSSSHKISTEVGDPDEINEIFDRISYAKGATIIRMMSHFLTSKVFRNGLSEYLKQMAYKSAEQDDLWKFLTEAAINNKIFDNNTTIKEIMDTWTLQTGYPLITVTRNNTNKIIRFEQERFVYVQSERKNSENLLWWVPITYTTSNELDFSNTRPKIWIKKEKILEVMNKTLSDSNWFIVNIQVTGYYRVNYDEDNWKSITMHLMDNKRFKEISPSNRAQLIDDALNLARAGYLNYEIALNLIQYLKHEDEYVPWKAAITALNFIDSMLIKEGEYHLIKDYLLKLLDMVYKTVGFDDSKDQKNMLNVYKRYEILSAACHLGHYGCIQESKYYFQNWMLAANPDVNNPISPNLRSLVYCTAIQTGSEMEWNFAFERYNNTKLVSSEKETILSALGCSKEPWILTRYLQRAISGTTIRKQDVYRVFAAVSSNNIVGQQIAFDFLRNHWNEIKAYMGNIMSSINGLVKLTTRKINSRYLYKELEDFIKKNYKEIGRPMQQVLESVKINIDWMDKNYKSIIEWLKKNTN